MEIAQIIDESLYEYYSEMGKPVPKWKQKRDPEKEIVQPKLRFTRSLAYLMYVIRRQRRSDPKIVLSPDVPKTSFSLLLKKTMKPT